MLFGQRREMQNDYRNRGVVLVGVTGASALDAERFSTGDSAQLPRCRRRGSDQGGVGRQTHLGLDRLPRRPRRQRAYARHRGHKSRTRQTLVELANGFELWARSFAQRPGHPLAVGLQWGLGCRC